MRELVPTRVKFRVASYFLLGLALLSLTLALPLPSVVKGLVFTVLLISGAYAGWCFWPKWNWPLHSHKLSPLSPHSFHLTFDDGPTAGLTDQILDILAKNQLKASFFVLVDKAVEQPEIIRRIVNEGHILGLHGQNHRLPFFRKFDDLKESLEKAKKTLEDIAGQPIKIYRPSHGWKNPQLVRAAHSLGLDFCFWDWGLWDTEAPPKEVLEGRLKTAFLLAEKRKKPVVLLHDGLNDDRFYPKHGTVLLESLATSLEAKN